MAKKKYRIPVECKAYGDVVCEAENLAEAVYLAYAGELPIKDPSFWEIDVDIDSLRDRYPNEDPFDLDK